MKAIIYNLACAVAMLATACSQPSTRQAIEEDPGAKAFTAAAHYVQDLKSEGKLPGFSKEDRGIIKSPRMKLGASVQYPLRISMQLEKAENKEAVYWFTLEKKTERSDWKIIEAWETDLRGEYRKNLVEKHEWM